MKSNSEQRYYESCEYDSIIAYRNSKDAEYMSNTEKVALRRIELEEKQVKEQVKELLKDCKDKDIDKQYYDMYDVYDVDCDDGTYGDKILIPKNKMMNNIHNK